MPLTIQFGPWAPDLTDTPMQMPDTQGPVPVPCADILNVFYANGSYKSIRSPIAAMIDGNTIVPISAAPVSAFSFYDIVMQQETVFAGTAAGVQQLQPNGTWSQINLITSQSVQLGGFAMTVGLGNFLNTSSLTSMVLSMTIGKFGVQVTGATFVAGQQVFSDPGKPPSIAPTNEVEVGLAVGFFGSVVSGGLLGGSLLQLFDRTGSVTVANGAHLTVGINADPTQSAFNSITVAGKTLASATATTYTFSASSNAATWFWSAQFFGLATGTTYPITIA